MDQLWPGICFLISLGCLSYIAWRFMRRQDFKKALLVVIIIGAILRIIGSTDSHLHAWDERYHALVAKNLMQHPLTPTLHEHPVLEFDNDNWVGSNLWVGKPSFPLWIMSGSIAIFGNNLIAVRLPSVLLGLLAIWLTFLIGRKLFDERTALLAAYFHAINGLVIELIGGRVSSDHVEVCFIVMVEISIYLIVLNLKPKPTLKLSFFAGVFMGLAFLSKWYPALIVLPVWLAFLVTYDKFNWKVFFKQGAVLIAGFSITALPWVFYMLTAFPEEMNAILFNALSAYSETEGGHVAPFYYYFHKVLVIFSELIYLALGFFIYRLFKTEKRAAYLGLLVWILVPMVIFSMAETKRQTYLLISAPAFFLVMSWFWFYIRDFYLNARYKIVTGILLVAIIVLPVRYMVERTKLFGGNQLIAEFYNYSPEQLEILDDKTIVFGTDDYVEIMFHTDVYAAYRQIPNDEILIDLNTEGFKILILENKQFIPFQP
ncbi:MAG: 4-amino-4-deoxy-L-arabinose transferase-like glycosyltransferase [Crocinitomix sp.]|jgi:4-amino-4-deoxy-L-arabinose transferase-like glycosyltransferase